MTASRLARLGIALGTTLATRLAGFVGGVALASGVAIAVLCLHAALLPEGHWQGDEFFCAGFARDGKLRFLWQTRITGWSPRPLSELLYYAFCRVAAASRQPFTVPFLALLWTVLLGAALASARRAALARRVLIGLATLCMFLLGHPVAEMFYWPAGAVAYLTTLAATTLALFLIVDGRSGSRGGALMLSAVLTACAASSEAGAMAAVPLALGLAVTAPHRRYAPLLLPPLLVTGFVFWTLAHNRLVSPEAVVHAPALRHLMQSLRPVPRVLLDDIRPAWPARLLFLLGVRWGWSGAARPKGAIPALASFAAALMLGACATIAAGLFQFGVLCCQRHDTLRQGWVVLAIVALAIASTRWSARPALSRLGPPALAAACLLGVVPRLGAIAADFRLMRPISASNHANWQAGRDPGIQAMIFRLPPTAAIAGDQDIPTGRFSEPAADAWYAHGIMHFFGKRSIVIERP